MLTRINDIRKHPKTYVADFLDLLVGVSILAPGFLLLIGVKSIPNVVASSLASVVFSYGWVLLFFLGGLLFLVGTLTRYGFPGLSWGCEYVGLLAIIFGVLIYGFSAAVSFGLLSGMITLGICISLSALLFKLWLPRRKFLHIASAKYDTSGNEVAAGGDGE